MLNTLSERSKGSRTGTRVDKKKSPQRYRAPEVYAHDDLIKPYTCGHLGARGNFAFIANQMENKDFTMLVKVYAKRTDEESQNEIERIWHKLKQPKG